MLAWRRITNGSTITFPFGEDAIGILIYTEDLKMAVQMLSANRPRIDSSDALGGDVQQRAAAYSTCLAYFGSYVVQGDKIIHQVDGSLFPNWSATMQARPFAYDGTVLVLSTPPVESAGVSVVNEISWIRLASANNS